jgi:hypothetical protein
MVESDPLALAVMARGLEVGQIPPFVLEPAVVRDIQPSGPFGSAASPDRVTRLNRMRSTIIPYRLIYLEHLS